MSGDDGRQRALSLAGRYAVPALIAAWAVAGSWGTEAAAAKTVVAFGVGAVLSRGREWPIAGLVAAFAGLFVIGSLPVPGPEDALLLAVVHASFLVGRFAPPRHQPWAASGVLLLLSANLVEPGREVAAADAVFPVLLTAGPWLLGLTVQVAARREAAAVRRAGEIDETRLQEVRRATTEERLRIAQELHDVVAHEISGLSLQAQVLRRRAESGTDVAVADLRDLERTARAAMTDVRRLLGVLRPVAESPPLDPADGLEELPALVARANDLGHRVRLVETGTPRPLPPVVSAAAYRIVQESLTNARRHGLPGTTSVEVGWRESEVSLVVRNPAATIPAVGDGHGLPGIRDRARLLGGEADVGHADGEWRVAVVLPAPVPVQRVAP
jgi:signal transduction histidine kinase